MHGLYVYQQVEFYTGKQPVLFQSIGDTACWMAVNECVKLRKISKSLFTISVPPYCKWIHLNFDKDIEFLLLY